METQVFRITDFSTDKYYSFAFYTRSEGKWPNIKYYTFNPLQYLGKYVKSERWGFGDGGGGAEIFEDENGKITRIEYDYDGFTCFVESSR